MTRKAYRSRYADEIVDHLEAIDRRYRRWVLEEIEDRVAHEPSVETRNRKPLVRPVAFGATWELRFGPGNRFRVFYRIDDTEREVWVLAIGEKVRERLHIGGEAVKL